MFKTLVIMILAVTAGTVGDILLAKGMKEMGGHLAMNLRGILNVAFQALTTPKLIIGTAMLANLLFPLAGVLSWEDCRWRCRCRPSITCWWRFWPNSTGRARLAAPLSRHRAGPVSG